MNEELFWALIDLSMSTNGDANSLPQQTLKLKSLLEVLDKHSFLDFIVILKRKMFNSYRWDLWAVVYSAYNWASDVAFEEFRAWLISRGRQKFELSLSDFYFAANLVRNYLPLKATGDESEEFYMMPCRLFEELFQQDPYDLLPEDIYMYGDRKPLGEQWLPGNLCQKYPQLCQLFGRSQSDFF